MNLELIKNEQILNYQIIWAVGQKNYEEVRNELKQSDLDIGKIHNVNILPYIYNMEEVMNVSDLLICRSGAITITEIAKLGKPAIFIPLPNVSQNHQEKNARVLEKIGAARIVLNNDVTAEKLKQEINSVITDKDLLKQMGEKANSINIDDVEDRIYTEIKKCTQK